MIGSVFFVVFGLGARLFAGSLAGMITGALEEAVMVGDPSVLRAGLSGIGIPKDSILEYGNGVED